ncbi:hypothetical protein HDU82_006634 [Entophlyctis luteolus]|nr:hypothetical protein HDU82_006634 [Entophlyctis luteolus]KAJ3394909.1 hypothetical protein HDU84_005844 [Entophlyctis sp. JEL0112]
MITRSFGIKLTLSLDGAPTVNHIGLYVAKARGYYAAAGLELFIHLKDSDSKGESTFVVTEPSSVENGMVTIGKLKTVEGREQVITTNKIFFENNRKLVQDFLDATQRGFDYAGAEKIEATKMMVEVVNRQHRVDLAVDALWDSWGGGVGFAGVSAAS